MNSKLDDLRDDLLALLDLHVPIIARGAAGSMAADLNCIVAAKRRICPNNGSSWRRSYRCSTSTRSAISALAELDDLRSGR
jgi:hypothetical protein